MYRLWTTIFLLAIITLTACSTPPETPNTPTLAPSQTPAPSQLPDHIPGTWVSPSEKTFALKIAPDGTVSMHAGETTIDMQLVSNDEAGIFALDDGFSDPYFATFENNRMYVYRTPDTQRQPAFVLAKTDAQQRILPPEGDPAPLPNDLIGTWGMPGARAVWQMRIHPDGYATFGGEAGVFTGTLSANTQAMLFLDDGSNAPVPVERKGNLLLFASPLGDENTLGFVLQKVDENGTPLPWQHESVVPLPLFEPTLAETVIITHTWSGQAEESPIQGVFALSITQTGATGTATYSVGTGANAMTQTVPITIPAPALNNLLNAAAYAPLLDEPYRAVLLASDNYPFYGVEIKTTDRTVRYGALSQLPIPLPWRVTLDNTSTVYVTYTTEMGRALYALDTYLRRDIQQQMVPWYRPWRIADEN